MKQAFYKIMIYLIGLSIFFLESCVNQFLDNPDKSVLTDQTQWSNEATADLFLNDIYHNLPIVRISLTIWIISLIMPLSIFITLHITGSRVL